MKTLLTAFRMPEDLVKGLTTFALEEGTRQGRLISLSEVVRESCRRTLKRADRLRRHAAQARLGDWRLTRRWRRRGR